MKRFLLCVCLLSCLLHAKAQPPADIAPRWKVKRGNPVVIEQPNGWSGDIAGVSFSPDGTLFATTGVFWPVGAERRGLVLLWDVRTGAARGELRGHTDYVQGLAWAPDGKTLATQSQDGALILWDVAKFSVRHRLSSGGKKALIRDDMKPEEVQAMLAQPHWQLGEWSPDGQTLAVNEYKLDVTANPPGWTSRVKLVDAATGDVRSVLAPLPGIVLKTAWTPDAKNVLAVVQIMKGASQAPSEVVFLDVKTGAVVRRVARADTRRYVVAISHDATRALLTEPMQQGGSKRSSNETAYLWDLTNDRPLWTQTQPSGSMRRAEFSRDGATLIAGSSDCDVTLHDAATGTIQKTLSGNGCAAVDGLAVSPDMQRIASVEEGLSTVSLWKLDEALPKPRYASQTAVHGMNTLRALAWRGDMVQAIAEVGTEENGLRVGQDLNIGVWSAATRKTEMRAVAEKRLSGAADISPDGSLLAIELGTQPELGTFRTMGVGIYDLREGKLLRVIPEKWGLVCVAWSPDGKTLATTEYESAITLWEPATGTKLRTLPAHALTMCWSPDGTTIAAGGGDGKTAADDDNNGDGKVQLFDVRNGTKGAGWGTKGTIGRLSFSPDGKDLAVGATTQMDTEFAVSSVQLYDTATGKAGRTFPTRVDIKCLGWTPDGTGVAAASSSSRDRALNGELKVWDAATGAERIALTDRCGIGLFAFSPDGTRLATHNWNRVRVWELSKQ